MELKDYAKYYIGCRCVNTWFPEGHKEYDRNWKLEGYRSDSVKPYCIGTFSHDTWTDSIKLILRKLGSYTSDELEVYNSLVGKTTDGVHDVIIHYDTPESFHWLLGKGFDLFRLIDAGLAIDSKTLK